MSESDKRPGRPRLPDAKSGSLRVAEHRASLEAEGWRRAEVLVPTRLRPRLQEIARLEGAGLADTMSALLQFGVEQYEARLGGSQPMRSAAGLPRDAGLNTGLVAFAACAQESLPSEAVAEGAARLADVVPVRTLKSASFSPPAARSLAARPRVSAGAALSQAPCAGASLGVPLSSPVTSSPLSTYLRKKKD